LHSRFYPVALRGIRLSSFTPSASIISPFLENYLRKVKEGFARYTEVVADSQNRSVVGVHFRDRQKPWGGERLILLKVHGLFTFVR
jgi:hypothetical protein